MKGSRMSLPTQMAIGMVLGVAAGALTPAMGLDPSWYKPVGQLFINLVRMVVVPLVLTTLVAGAASVGDVSKLGRVAGKTLAYYLVTTAVAVVIGLVLANIFQPGSGLSISTEGLKAKEVAPPTLVDVFLNIVPINPIEALSKGNMLQIIFFALLFGFGLSVIGDKGKQVLHFFDGAADVMIKVTGFVMLYAPIGVFGLMAYTVSMHGLGVLLPLIKLVLVMYLACILQILIVYLPCVKVTGLTTSRFLKGLASPMMIAFTTCSSAAALSTTLLSVQKLGASRSVSSFSIPLTCNPYVASGPPRALPASPSRSATPSTWTARPSTWASPPSSPPRSTASPCRSIGSSPSSCSPSSPPSAPWACPARPSS